MIKHAFNMIEVALAMGVIMLGVVGVLALMPPAMDMSRDSRNDAIAIEAASNIQEFLKILAKNNTSSGFSNYVANGSLDSTAALTLNTTAGRAWVVNSSNVNVGPELYYQGSAASPSATVPMLYCIIENNTRIPMLHVRMFATDISPCGNAIAEENVKRVYVEISWPIDMSQYNNRQKRFFVIDLPLKR